VERGINEWTVMRIQKQHVSRTSACRCWAVAHAVDVAFLQAYLSWSAFCSPVKNSLATNSLSIFVNHLFFVLISSTPFHPISAQIRLFLEHVRKTLPEKRVFAGWAQKYVRVWTDGLARQKLSKSLVAMVHSRDDVHATYVFHIPFFRALSKVFIASL
jgi:hypothetical protein